MSESNPDMAIGNVIKIGLVALVGLIGGPFLLIGSFAQPVPQSVDSLTRVEGPVTLEIGTRRTRRIVYEYPVLVINREKYNYIDWFPGSDLLAAKLRPGENITIWTDANQNRWVWQIERPGETIVPFESVRSAVADNQVNTRLGGGVLLAFGIAAAVGVAVQTRPLWWTSQEPKKGSTAPRKKKKPKKRVRLEELPEDD